MKKYVDFTKIPLNKKRVKIDIVHLHPHTLNEYNLFLYYYLISNK